MEKGQFSLFPYVCVVRTGWNWNLCSGSGNPTPGQMYSATLQNRTVKECFLTIEPILGFLHLDKVFIKDSLISCKFPQSQQVSL